MIQARLNRNSPNNGLLLGNQDSGCCVETTSACLYRFQFTTTPTTFVSFEIDGVVYDFAHTYSTPEALNTALLEALTKPVVEGGAGLAIHDGDIKIYLDPFATTADRLTIEMVSGITITNFITNVGTQTSETAKCTPITMCVRYLDYVLSDPISIVINNKALTLTTYATAALLRTAILAQLTAQGLDSIAKAVVRTSATAGHADVWIYAIPDTDVYHDGVLMEVGKCSQHYIV